MGKPVLTLIIGPTCSGKTTLMNRMVSEQGYTKLLTATDRPPREGETGEDYIFHSIESFDKDRSNMFAIRTFEVYSGAVYRYGVLRSTLELLARYRTPSVMVIDPIGAEELGDFLRPRGIDPFVIFLSEGVGTLMNRARKRSNESNQSINEYLAHLDETRDRIFRERGLFDRIYTNRDFDLMLGNPISE